MELSNFNNDRTVNRIAFCSAVVAGFAYVGYSVVRNAFSRKKKRRDDMNDDLPQRIFLRRLSQTTQTDGLLGDLDLDGSNRISLRPMSVQERIKELNVRARQFADAVVAIQSNGSPRPHGVSARSLQVFQAALHVSVCTLLIMLCIYSLLRGHLPVYSVLLISVT